MEFHQFSADYVRRLLDGDPFVGDHFSGYFSELIWIKLRARLKSVEMIREIQQETFARVIQALHQKGGLTHPERLGAFVNSVCNNVLLERLRAQSRHPQADLSDRPDARIDLDAPLVNQERIRLVEMILAELSVRDRELLRMILLDEADRAAACRRFGVDQDYFRVLLHRAKSRFAEKLASQKAHRA